MKFVVWLIAVCAGLAVARADDSTKTDLDKLQGVWKVVAMENDGKKASEDSVKGIRMTIKGDKLLLKEDNKEEEASFKLDPMQKPKTMDLTIKAGDKMEVVKLIYDLRGDDLKLCGGRAGKDRPKDFVAKGGMNLIVFKREKE
jgi:uncharacterized protein (TIGR03067 family)